MNPEQAWQSALGQLQMEMPKASFDTWVRDTRMINYEAGLFTVSTRNAYAREWLESRLTSTVTRLLMGIMNRDVEVKFVTENERFEESETTASKEDAPGETEEEAGDGGSIIRGRSQYLTAYEEIVQPHKIILAPGYLIRLLPERGAAALFAYLGFAQVAYMEAGRGSQDAPKVLFKATVVSVAKFAGANRTAFHKLMTKTAFWDSLRGLVERGEHNTYTLFRTLPLSRADAQSIVNWLRVKVAEGKSLEGALQDALAIREGYLVGELLKDIYQHKNLPIEPDIPVYVPDIAQHLAGRSLSLSESTAAENLHNKIIYAFKELAVRHYFVTRIIQDLHLSTDQAALVLAVRYRCYANPLTGEVVNLLSVRGGYAELASWIGLSRPKSIWEWVSGYSRKAVGRSADGTVKTTNVRKNGIPGFLQDVSAQQGDTPPAKSFFVRLLEPVELDDGLYNWTPEEDRTKYTLSMAQKFAPSADGGKPGRPKKSKRDRWSLDDLMARAGIFPQVKDKLAASGVTARRLLAWIYFCYSNRNTSGYRVNAYPAKMLGENPEASPGAAFDRLASLPPSIVRKFIEATPEQMITNKTGTGIPEWDELMGPYNGRLDELRRILFG